MPKEDVHASLIDKPSKRSSVYVLRTGIQWNALPRELGASSTIHDRFQQWEKVGFFKALWQAGLYAYDELQGIQWEWQAADGTMSKAPFAGAATGPNPTDRGKQGTKRSLLTDGAGIPLALVIDGAHRHDVKLLSATLDGLVIERPIFTLERTEQLCLDAAYDSTPVYKELLARSYWPHVRSRGEERMERLITTMALSGLSFSSAYPSLLSHLEQKTRASPYTISKKTFVNYICIVLTSSVHQKINIDFFLST